jgi:hypothetical protein
LELKVYTVVMANNLSEWNIPYDHIKLVSLITSLIYLQPKKCRNDKH